MVELRERARERRRELGWTQEMTADKAGVSLRAYQYFETGQSTPQGGNLQNILRALGLDHEAGEEEQAEATRESWPGDVRVYLDMKGAYLMTLTEEERDRFIFEDTQRIFHPKG